MKTTILLLASALACSHAYADSTVDTFNANKTKEVYAARLALIKSFNENELKTAKKNLQRQSDDLERSFARNLISITGYYQQRSAITAEAASLEIEALRKERLQVLRESGIKEEDVDRLTSLVLNEKPLTEAKSVKNKKTGKTTVTQVPPGSR